MLRPPAKNREALLHGLASDGRSGEHGELFLQLFVDLVEEPLVRAHEDGPRFSIVLGLHTCVVRV